ncbi:MAG: LemA family protein [Lentisphaerae bacterium ADurb.Bin242]|nr:MAG: LemA family protein [Lentisphaerae bacterium ADurb.Bin242]
MESTGIVVLVIVIGIVLLVWLGYNSLVSKRNLVDNAFALIDTQLKKRCDLIPNLVASVKNYMKHESSTLTTITELRSKAIKPEISAAERVELNNQITDAMRSILV